MTDMRRTLLWVVFSMSLFLIYDAWNRHNGQASFFSPAPARTAPAGAAPRPGVAGATGAVNGAAVAGATPVGPAASGAGAAVAERVTINTDLVKATLDTTGGTLVRLELLKQHEQSAPDGFDRALALIGMAKPQDAATQKRNIVLFDESAERLYVAQTGLIPASGGSGLPNHHTVMTLVPGDRTLADGQNQLSVKFESPIVGGVKLVKTYTFTRGDYVINVKNEVVNESNAPISPRLYLELTRDGNPLPGGSSLAPSAFVGPAIYDDAAKFKKIDFKSIEKRGPNDKPDHETNADSGWIAMVQHYFVSAWLIDTADGAKQPREYFTGKADITNDETGAPAHVYSVGMFIPLGELAPGASKTFDARLYAGPEEEQKLAALAPGLELVKDYGVFRLLSEPLFWLLTQLHRFLGNWGWAIVGLVLTLRVAFFWLNLKAYTSMAKMKSVAPRINEMKERMKDKPQQMQQEMMKIYREEKINPLGSCLPMVLQMPFFMGLYWVLLSSVEMRNAPWIGWITDLSAKDPFFILPLLMTCTSLLQTWLNPTPADPVQAKMMWIMPLAFSVMFFVFPAGLVLYWLTNNILSIAQQYLINKKLGVLNK
jgi:YidC/Oxa1 family membrane protein insertase